MKRIHEYLLILIAYIFVCGAYVNFKEEQAQIFTLCLLGSMFLFIQFIDQKNKVE